jgi:hypothetical protein
MSEIHDQTRHDAGFVHEFRFELLFADSPTDVVEKVRGAASQSGLTVSGGDILEMSDGSGSVHLDPRAIAPSVDALKGAAEQSWNWREGREAAGSSRFAIVAHDVVEDSIDPRQRIATLRTIIATLVDALSPLAVHSLPSQQLLDPRDLVEAFRQNPGDELYGFVNVRFFKIEGHTTGVIADYDETVMDTLGLGAIGLHDLQCQFKHLEATRVGQLLYNTAYYIYEKGPVIESGHSIRGLTPEQKWTCRFEDGVIEPRRVVLDLDPGKPYAAGPRER